MREYQEIATVSDVICTYFEAIEEGRGCMAREIIVNYIDREKAGFFMYRFKRPDDDSISVVEIHVADEGSERQLNFRRVDNGWKCIRCTPLTSNGALTGMKERLETIVQNLLPSKS